MNQAKKIADLRDIIQKGENSAVEFKADEVRPEAMAREIIAFANSQGGLILLGVTN